MSAFDSSKTANTTSNTSGTSTAQSSYSGQVSDLNAAYDAALKAFQTSGQATAPTNYVAPFDPSQLDAFRSMIGYGNNNTLPNAQAGTGTAVAGSGAAGTQGALAGLAGYDPGATNNPNTLVDAAKQYMAGQDIPAQVRQAMQSGVETARDVTLPGIEQGAALTGNTNSSRVGNGGIADGLVERGLAETGANLTGALSSNAFQNGLQLAQQQAQNNNTGKLGALSAEGTVGNTAGLVGNTQQNSSVLNMIQQLTAAANGGAGLTAGQQASLDNMLKQYQAGVTAPYAPLDQLMQIISGNTGQTTNTTGTQTGTGTMTSSPSLVSDIGSVMGMLGKAPSFGTG